MPQAPVTPESTFETLKLNTVNAVSSMFPLEGTKNRLEVSNVYADDKLSTDDVTSQAEAKYKEGTWGIPIKGDIKLVDKSTGTVLDVKKGAVLARLPKLTSRYGFIVGGSEYQVDNLLRLKSGAYARIQQNGELETEFNLSKRPTGRNFSIHFDPHPEKRQFSFKYGNSHIPIYPILKTLGVSDDELEHSWGKEIFNANVPKKQETYDRILKKFWKSTSVGGPEPHNRSAYEKYVHDYFDSTGILPETTQITLGKPFTKVDADALTRASAKILGVSRGEIPQDDRDSLAFKEVASVEDFIPETITLYKRAMTAKLKNTIDHKGTVGEIYSPEVINHHINEFFHKGFGVSERSEQVNPVAILGAHKKTSILSKEMGGIKGERSLTPEMHALNPSHMGFLDPMNTPEGGRVGITLHLSTDVRKRGKDLEVPVFNTKTGKAEYINATNYHYGTVVMPDQVKWSGGKPIPISDNVKAKLPGGDIAIIPFKDADYVASSAKGMFSYTSNLVPFLPSNQGTRVLMADKQMEQAISLKHREQPLVQVKTDSKDPEHTFEKLIGRFVVTKAPIDGTVTKITPDTVYINDGKKTHGVSVYNNFPLNDPKSMLHSTPVVKVGDTVKTGQMLADTNFTDKGVLSLGTNLRVGFMPFKGYNYEDGIVVSQSTANKLTSEHLHRKELTLDPSADSVSIDKFKAFSSAKSANMTREQWDNLDSSGVVKEGSRVTPGQVLVAAVGKTPIRKKTGALSPLGARAFKEYKDKSLVWDEDHVGVVTKVVRSPNDRSVKVFVKTEEPAVLGDKVTGRHGNKGIIVSILPDHEMPYTVDKETGEKKPLEMILNPDGIPSRINLGQMFETAASKIAEKTGKTYIVDNFSGPNTDYGRQVKEDLHKHGLSDQEEVYDPSTPKRPLGKVFVGKQHILKLQHQVEKKLKVRGGGTNLLGEMYPVDTDRQPVKGGEFGGQGFGQLDMYALLGHDARNNIREMATYKSDHQDADFWSAVQEGHEPPPPRPSFSYEKFLTILKGMGVNTKKEGTGIRLLPMTDHEILRLANDGRNQITNGEKTVLSKNLKEEAGGLFDLHKTGGLDGDRWAYIKLGTPMPNPMFVGQNNRPGPIPVLLGIGIGDIDRIMRGEQALGGEKGGRAIENALKKINVDAEIESLRKTLSTRRGPQLDRDNKKLKYLLALKSQNLRPEEAYVLHNIPVIPPKFRPVSQTPRGDLHFSPVNGLYRQLFILNDKVTKFDPKTFSEKHFYDVAGPMWDAMKAMEGIGTYRPLYDQKVGGNRKLKSMMDLIQSEEQPKQGMFQSKLVKRRLNLSMRTTITPEPSLGLDQVGLPKNAALELYKPFVVAELGRWGFTPLQAQEELKKSSPTAFKALAAVVAERPVLMKRDPVLHKFGVQAFKPILVEGSAIKIHPLVCGGTGADFDGDTMAVTVPLSKDAVEEAKKMFPSKNLFSPTSGDPMFVPAHDSLLGLNLVSSWGNKTGKTFDSVEALKKAVGAGDVHHTDVVKVKGFDRETTLGRIQLAECLPSTFSQSKAVLYDPSFVLTKRTLKPIMRELAKKHANEFPKHADKLKDLGFGSAYNLGFSIGLKDTEVLPERNAILTEAHKRAASARKSIKDKETLNKELVSIYTDATKRMDELVRSKLANTNNFARMIYSGARGDEAQLRQMVAAPMLMQGYGGRTLAHPVTKSYSEGLDVGDYWFAQHGARKGIVQKGIGTSEPGSLTKDIISTALSTQIAASDCGTKQGIHLSLDHPDVHDRYTAAEYKLRDGTVVPAGTLLSPEIGNKLRDNGEKKVLVRSALKCEHPEGVCAKCYGLSEKGTDHTVGTNIGVLASQALGEPTTQMSMKDFHMGGVQSVGGKPTLGAQSGGVIARLKTILHMPKKLRDEATLATVAGKVQTVDKDPSGGVSVVIGGVPHRVLPHLVNPAIKPGYEVKKVGERLSAGFINPHTLLDATKDVHVVQNHLTDDLEDLYGPGRVRRRNFEVAVRGMTNLSKIKDPGHSQFLHGDVVPRSIVEDFNKNLQKGQAPILHEPIIRGVREVQALASQDWMARLNYQRLADTIQQGAAEGWKSEIHGPHPIPGMAMGSEFGKPPVGKPQRYY